MDTWFVRNLRGAEWRHAQGRGAVSVLLHDFEGERRSIQVSVNTFVLQPGEAMSLYHWEADQEDFLVLFGEAALIIEGEARPLRRWDFVRSPPKTAHVIVGGGDRPCVILAVGGREHSTEPDSLGFPVDEVALRYGASVDQETMDGVVAYANVPPRRPTGYREGWLPD